MNTKTYNNNIVAQYKEEQLDLVNLDLNPSTFKQVI